MASVQQADSGAQLRAIAAALGVDAAEGGDVAELTLTAIRKLQQAQQQHQQHQSPKAPVVVPRSRSSSICSSSMLLGTAAAAASTAASKPAAAPPAVLHAHPDPARCDVAIRCRILNARLPPVQPLPAGLEEGKDEEEASVAAPMHPASPGQEERMEVSSDEEQEQEQEQEAAASESAGKRKRTVSTTEDSGVEGHKKLKQAGEAACASEHSCSSSTAGASVFSTLTAGTAAAKAKAAVATTPEQYQVRVIHAEGAVLSAQSEYFARAFGGGWKETASRELTLTFDDEEDFEDFARLVRLSHGPSFLHEEETAPAPTSDSEPEGDAESGACTPAYVVVNRRELRREELLRLLLVADSFSCLGCVRSCTRQLCRTMTYALACKVFVAVPESLKDHAHIRRLLVAAGRALAQGIGVLGGTRTWSRRRPDLMRGGKDKYVRFLPDLHPRLQLLPPLALEFLLRSDALRVRSENDVFAFLCAYIKGRQQPPHTWGKAQAQRAFNTLLPCLRFHAMTGEFLTTVVSHNRWLLGSGRLLEVLRAALCFRDSRQHVRRYLVHQQQHHEEEAAAQGGGGGAAAAAGEASDDEEDGGAGANGPEAAVRARRRAAAEAAREFADRCEDEEDETYELKGTFSLEKCLNLPPGKFIRRYLGVVQGVPCFLDLERSVLDNGGGANGGHAESLGLFFGLCNNLSSDAKTVGAAGAVPVGSLVRYDITVRDCQRGPSVDVFANARQPWGFRDVLGLPWQEVVRQGSLYFDARGRMEVRVRMRFLRDAQVPAGGEAFFDDEDSSDDDQEGEEEDDDMSLGGLDISDEEDSDSDDDDGSDGEEEMGGLAQVIAGAFAGAAALAPAEPEEEEENEENEEQDDAAAPAAAEEEDGMDADSEGSADA